MITVRFAALRSSIRTWMTETAKVELLETSRRYLYSADFLLLLIVGIALSLTSIGNLKSLPTAAMLRVISVSSMGALFHAYCDVFEFWMKVSC